METIRVRENHSFSCRHNCRNPLLIIMRLALIPRLIARSWIKYHLWRLGQYSILDETINALLVVGPRCFPEVQVESVLFFVPIPDPRIVDFAVGNGNLVCKGVSGDDY